MVRKEKRYIAESMHKTVGAETLDDMSLMADQGIFH